MKDKFPIGTDVIVTNNGKTYEGVAYDEDYILYVVPDNEAGEYASQVIQDYVDNYPPLGKYLDRYYHCLLKSDERISHAKCLLGGE